MLISRLLRPCLLCLAFLLLLMPALYAAPAPYYLWMNRIDGSRVCAQLSLGPSWQKMGGPYKDSRCQKPVRGKY
jgi:hypothetical protein